MENSIQNIELINDYLNKGLSESESKIFEKRLKSDSGFKEDYETHVVFLEGLKRQALKGEIRKGKQSYFRNKWFRYLGGICIALAILGLVYVDVINSKTNDSIQNELDKSEIVIDSVLSIGSEEVQKEEIILKDTLKAKTNHEKQIPTIKKVVAKKDVVKVEIPKKPSQNFSINVKKDTTIICKEGTKLFIQANSFVNKDNNTISGEINLKVTEYYQLSDILLANLTTQSDGKQLETGGMLQIQASESNRFLSLKKNTNIEILFPTKKKNMQLFSGEWNNGIINWKPCNSCQDVEVVLEEIEIIEEDIDVPFAVVEEVPVYPGCEDLSKTVTRKCTSDAIQKFVQRNFNTEIAKNLGLVGRQRVNVLFKINKNGNIVDIRSRGNNPDLEREANRVIAALPKMLPGKQRGKTVSVPYSLPIIFEAEGVSSVGRSSINKRVRDSIYTKRFEARIAGKDSSQVTASEVNGYILRTSKLGWINCDRFTNRRNRIKYKLKIEDAKGTMRVSMVFKSVNSVLPSWRSGKEFDFRTVPNNEDVLLIAVKQDEGKIYLDVVEAKTEDTPNIEFNFKEVSLKELKSELKKLNKLF